MIDTWIWRASRIRPARGQASALRRGGSRGRRARVQLWTLLHAPALFQGTTGGPGDVAFIEDDRRRLAGRQAR